MGRLPSHIAHLTGTHRNMCWSEEAPQNNTDACLSSVVTVSQPGHQPAMLPQACHWPGVSLLATAQPGNCGAATWPSCHHQASQGLAVLCSLLGLITTTEDMCLGWGNPALPCSLSGGSGKGPGWQGLALPPAGETQALRPPWHKLLFHRTSLKF